MRVVGMRVIGVSVALLIATIAPTVCAEPHVDYTSRVKPILSSRCYACHGALQQKSGLRLDTGASALKGGRHGPDVVPGKSVESRLILAVTGAAGVEKMPAEGDRLTVEQIAVLRAW